MQGTRFRDLLVRVERELTPDQHIALRERLDRIESTRATEFSLGTRARAIGRCGHCGAEGATKHGRDRLARQRFRCRPPASGGCGRTFNILTGTPFAGMRKPERWHGLARALANGFVSVDRLAELDLGVCRLTIWRWRNRFLKAQADHQADRLGGVIEADETYFRTSHKGSRGWVRGQPPENRPPRYRGEKAIRRGLSREQVAVLTAIDSAGNIVETRIAGLAQVHPVLTGRIEPGSVLCSDGARSYVRVAHNARSEHRRIWTPVWKSRAEKLRGGRPRRKGQLGLGRVNARHAGIKSFINHQARGVSTENLPTYLGWSRALARPDFTPQSLLHDALAA